MGPRSTAAPFHFRVRRSDGPDTSQRAPANCHPRRTPREGAGGRGAAPAAGPGRRGNSDGFPRAERERDRAVAGQVAPSRRGVRGRQQGAAAAGRAGGVLGGAETKTRSVEKMNKDEIVDASGNLTVGGRAELGKALEEKFGVTAAAPVAMAAAPAGGGGAGTAQAVEEQTEFDAILKTIGDKKIQVIKVVRELTGLGLKEAKDLVDGALKPVKEQGRKADAEQIKTKLEAEGAQVEIK